MNEFGHTPGRRVGGGQVIILFRKKAGHTMSYYAPGRANDLAKGPAQYWVLSKLLRLPLEKANVWQIYITLI